MFLRSRLLFKVVVVIVALSVFSVLTTSAQPKKFSENYKALALAETKTMKTRYNLTPSQSLKIEKLNILYYTEINAALLEKGDRIARAERITRIRTNREKQLQTLFTGKQYTAYRKDMDAAELRAKQRVKELNENARKRRVQTRE